MAPSTVILDRDGVVNADSPDFIKSVAEWQPLPGSLEAIARLKQAGLRVVIASNQPGLGRGLFSYDALLAIHDRLTRQLAELGVSLDGIFFCPHAPDADCACRKPRPGLLKDIMRRWNLRAADCVLIGDNERDIAAARALGMPAIAIVAGEAQPPASEYSRQYPSLAAAVDALLPVGAG